MHFCVFSDCELAHELEVLINHVREIRRKPEFAASIIYFILEANHCRVRTKSIYHAVKGFHPCRFLNSRTDEKHSSGAASGGELTVSVDNPNRIGIWLGQNANQKLRMANHFASILHTNACFLYSHFIHDQEQNTVGILDEQLRNLEFVHQVTEHPTNPFTPQRFEVSGKRGHQKDDVAISLLEASYYSALVWYEANLCRPFCPRVLVSIKKIAEAAPELSQTEIRTLYFH